LAETRSKLMGVISKLLDRMNEDLTPRKPDPALLRLAVDDAALWTACDKLACLRGRRCRRRSGECALAALPYLRARAAALGEMLGEKTRRR
jgi:hypothetical protein